MRRILPKRRIGVAPSTLAQYNFDNASYVDSSGRGNVLTFDGSPSFQSGRITGSAVSLGGTADSCIIPSIGSFDSNSKVSFGAWFYPANVSGVKEILTLYDTSAPARFGTGLYLNGGTANAYTENPAVGADIATGISVQANAWAHAFVVLDGGIKLYVNGVFVSSTAYTTNTTTAGANNLSWSIGKLNQNATNYYWFAGKIAEVRIINRAISANEVLNIYALKGEARRRVFSLYSAAGTDTPITVPAASIVVAGQAPTVNRTQSVTVPAASIAVAAHAPTINQTRSIAVPVADIAVNAHAQTVNRTQSVTVPAANIVVAANAPTVTQQTNTPITVPAAGITVAAHAPTVNRIQSILVPAAPIIVDAYAPTVEVEGGIWTNVAAASTSWSNAAAASTTWTNV